MSSSPSSSSSQPFITSLLSLSELNDLEYILFGNSYQKEDKLRWYNQDISYIDLNDENNENENNIKNDNENNVKEKDQENNIIKPFWGLKQLVGGPCGVLATLQCYILYELLYSNESLIKEDLELLESKILNNISINDPFTELLLNKNIDLIKYRNELLIKSIIKTLKLVNNNNIYRIISLSNDTTNELAIFNITEISNIDDLIIFINSIADTFSSKYGVIAYLMSILLTRTIRFTYDDMDDPSQPLVGIYGHCSQELVNLLLTGQATSNVFDGAKLIGGFPLRGVTKSPTIGFLTLQEVLRYTKIGDYYKAPTYPIYVVGGTSHYTVTFGINPKVSHLDIPLLQTVEAKLIFNNFDPEENGFIMSDNLERLKDSLPKLQSLPIKDLQRNLDEGGIILWPKFESFYRKLCNNNISSQNNSDWNCLTCTYINGIGLNCEMCGSLKPENNNSSLNISPVFSKFLMYHFNGINRQLSAVIVYINDMLSSAILNDDSHRGLREVLQTKWLKEIEYCNNNMPKLD